MIVSHFLKILQTAYFTLPAYSTEVFDFFSNFIILMFRTQLVLTDFYQIFGRVNIYDK